MANFGASSTPRNTSLLYLQEGGHHRSARLFNGEEDPVQNIRARRCDMDLWPLVDDIHVAVRTYIEMAGFDGVLRTGYHKIDHALITALVERWRPETHTFHFPIGEATVTLQDVQVLWALPIDGRPVSGIYEAKSKELWLEDVNRYLGFYPEDDQIDSGRIKFSRLIAEINQPLIANPRRQMERARIYLLALLGGHLFSDSRSKDVSLNYLKHFEDMCEASTFSWGSGVLAYLYRQLCNAAETKDIKGIQGPLVLLQLWAWERMPHIAPVPRIRPLPQPEEPNYPHCYATKWRRSLSHTGTPAHVLVTYRAAFTALQEGQFIWCPYAADFGRLPPACTNHQELWRYIGWLVFWNVAEPHVPNRVSRQFGFIQRVPEELYFFDVRLHKRVHHGKLTGGRGTNWVEKKAAEVACWNDRYTNIYHFTTPLGVGVAPDYMQWFYERTVLVITSPAAQNPPTVYPEWGGIQQTQNETLRQIHDRAQSAIDAGVGNNQLWQDFVQLPRQSMAYGHMLDRMNYGSQQYSFPPPPYYPRPQSPQRDFGGFTVYQPQNERQYGPGGSGYQGHPSQYQAGSSSAQPRQQYLDSPDTMFDELLGDQSNWPPQPNYQQPNTDMVARRAAYADTSPVHIQSFGDFGLGSSQMNQPPNEETGDDVQDRRSRPSRTLRPTHCGTGSHLLQQQPPRRR